MSRKLRTCLSGVVVLAVFLAPLAAGAARGPLKVGVVDFYAPTPLAPFSGFFPERFAADDLTDLLARAAGDRLVMIPRDAVQRSEQEMRWGEADVLHFARLRALAGAVGADRLVVGWIPQLTVEGGGGGRIGVFEGGDGASGASRAEVSLVIQVFDAGQGRLVDEARYSASDVGGPRSELAKRVIDHALRPAIPALLDHLTAPGP
ncbi:MAG TPA: hypothetical protein VEW91_04090 [bacterium]|nr:hypothetical protein [bacterium]